MRGLLRAAALIAVPALTGCAHILMMGGMGAGIGMMRGHHGNDRACETVMAAAESHLQRIEAARPDSLAALVPVHVRRVEALLARCPPQGSEDGSGAGEPALLVEAIRQDLARLRQLPADELEAFMPEHVARVRRLLELLGSAHADHAGGVRS